MSDTDIREKEEGAVLDDLEKDFSPEEKSAFDALSDNDPKEGGLYNPEDSGKKKSGLTRKKMAIGGLSGILVGGGMWGIAFVQGPLQFMQLSQLMQKFHFADNTSIMDDRYGKLLRYARNRNRPYEQRRLGEIGNKVSASIDAKMAESGLAFEFEPNGTQKGIRVLDPDKGGVARMRELGYTPKVDGQGLIYELEGADRYNRGAIKSLNSAGLTSANHGKRAGPIHSRVQKVRSNATFRFLGKYGRQLDALEGDARTKYRQKWDDFVKRGADADFNARATPTEDPDTGDETTSETDERAAGELNDAAEAGEGLNGTEKVNAVENDIRSKLTGGNATLIAVTVVCIANSIADGFDSDVYESIILPSIRMATGTVVIGDQLRDFSNQEFEIIEASVRSEQLFDEEKETSWAGAQSIQTNLGNDPDGPVQNPASKVRQTQNPVLAFIGDVPGLDTGCSIIGNPIVGVGISLVTAGSGVGFAVDIASDVLLSAAAQPLVEMIARWVSLEQIPSDIAGAEFGYVIDQGSRMMANDTAMAFGGVELTGTQEAYWDELQYEEEQLQLANMSVGEKLFAFDNTHSLTSRAVRSPVITNPEGSVRSVATSFFNVFGSLGNTFAGLFTGSAHAQSRYQYDFAQYGFSVEDMNNPKYEDPYVNEGELFKNMKAARDAEIACEPTVDPDKGETYWNKCEFLYRGGHASSLRELNTGDSDYTTGGIQGDSNNNTGNNGERKANGEACFAATISANGDIEYGESINFITMPDECSEDRREDFMRYRFYLLDLSAGHAAACYSGDEASCGVVGQEGPAPAQNSTSTAGPIIGNTAGIECAAGTTDLGEFDGYSGGEKYRIRLCSIPGFNQLGGLVQVNSTVSKNWLDMFQASEQVGLGLSAASSFRSMEQQERLYALSQNGGNEAARPGYSNHQMGLAVDIDINPNGKDPSLTTCKQNPAAYPRYDWLAANAPSYGLNAAVDSECWHWSSTGK